MSILMLDIKDQTTQTTGITALQENQVRSLFPMDNTIKNENGIPSPMARDDLYYNQIFSKAPLLYYYERTDDTGATAMEASKYSMQQVHYTLLKALFYNQIEPEKIEKNDLGTMGEILARKMNADENNIFFTVFKLGKKICAYSAPKCLILPVPSMSGADIDTLNSITGQMDTSMSNSRPDNMFIRWVRNLFPDYALLPETTEDENIDEYDKMLGVRFSTWFKTDAGYNMTDIKTFQGDVIHCDGCNADLSITGGSAYMNENNHIPVCDACGRTLPLPEHLDQQSLFFENTRSQYYIWKNNTALPKGCMSRNISSDGCTYNFGNLHIKVYGNVIDKEDVFCEKIVKLNTGNEDTPNHLFPSLPINADMLYCIENGDKDKNVSRNIIADDRCEWQIKLKGIDEIQKVTPQVESVAQEANIFSYPNFKANGYKRCSVYFDPLAAHGQILTSARFISYPEMNGKSATEAQVRLRKLGKGSSLTCSEGLDGFILYDRQDKQYGYFSFNKNELNKDSGKTYYLGIDFGTTATAFAYKPSINEETKTLSISDMTVWYDRKDGANAQNWVKGFNRNSSWLPIFGRDSDIVLRSELTVNKSIINSIDEIYEKIHTNPKELTKFVTQNRTSRYNMPDNDYISVTGNEQILKWHELAQDFKWNTENSRKGYVYSTLYLEYALDMAIASMINETKSIPGGIQIKATFPLAFSRTQYSIFSEILDTVTKSLSEATGIRITADTSPVSESLAGIYGCGRSNNIACAVDLGGKTADISMFDSAQNMILLDSIRYGGTDLIRIMTGDRLYPDKAGKDYTSEIQTESDSAERKAEILRSLFRRPSNDINRMLSDESYSNKKQLLTTVTNIYFDGLLLYLKKLIDASIEKGLNPTNEIDIFLLGNGWGMLRGTGSLENAGETTETLIKKKLEKHAPGWKFNTVSPGQFPKHAVSKGLMVTPSSNFANDMIKTYAGLDTHVNYANQSYSDEIQWTDQIPYALRDGVNPSTVHMVPKSPDFDISGFKSINDADIINTMDTSGLLASNNANETEVKGSILGKYMSDIFLRKLTTLAENGE